MARGIPTNTGPLQLGRAPGAPNISFAGPESTAAVGRAYAGAADSLVNAGENQLRLAQQGEAKIKQRQEYDDHLWSENKFTEAQRKWIQWSQDVQKNGSENVVEQFDTGYKQYQQESLAAAPTKGARDRLKMKLDDFGTQLFDTSLKIEAGNRQKNTVNTFGEMLVNSSDSIAQIPEMYASQQMRLQETLDLSLKQGRISKEVGAKMQQQINDLAADAAEAMIPKNVEMAREIITNAKGIDWTRRHAILNEIGRASETNSTLANYQQRELAKSNFESVLNTGKPLDSFNVDAYAATFPKNQQQAAREEAISQIKVAQNSYVGKSEMMGGTATKIMEVLQKYDPSKNPSAPDFADKQQVFEHLNRIADQQMKAMREDPFTYARQDPIVDGAWKLVENLPEDAKPELRSMLTGQAMDAAVNFQRSLNIPEGKLSVMSNGQAQGLASKINNGNVQDVQQTFSTMQQNFGKYYANAFRDLARLPEGQRIDGAMQIVALHMGQPFIADFIQSIRTPSSDYKLDADDQKNIAEKLRTDKHFMAFSAALTSANPGAVSYVDDFRKAIDKYSTSLYFRGKADSPTKAVESATELILGNAYAFTEVAGSSIAIKRVQGKDMIADKDVPKIQVALNSFPKTLDINKIDLNPFVFPPNLSPETKQQSVKDSIANDTFWSTNPENDGAILYMNGAQGQTSPVRYRDGKNVEIKFLDAIAKGRARDADLAKNPPPIDYSLSTF